MNFAENIYVQNAIKIICVFLRPVVDNIIGDLEYCIIIYDLNK